MKLYVGHIPPELVVVMAGDYTPWSRRPVTVGQGYGTLIWVPESEGSWVLPSINLDNSR